MRFSFSKKQRLKRKKWIQQLFEAGSVHRSYPLKCYFLPWDAINTPQVLIAVPKRHIKKAVMRNKIKRRIREAYRQRQHAICPEVVGTPLLLGFVFVGKEVQDTQYRALAQSIRKSINHINQQYSQAS